jgi:hypothetical protein
VTCFARLLVIIALLALALPATAGAKKTHKPDRAAQPADVRAGDSDDDDDRPCKEKTNRGKHRGWGPSKPGNGPRPHRTCEPDPGTGGDRAFGLGTTDGLSFRFDASSGPDGENPNPGGTETAFVQFTDASGDTYAGPVRCLVVVGNQAVIGFDNQDPENPDTDVILYVEDNASTGASDRFEAEATLSPESCPAVRVPASEVTSGDITVQDNTAGGGGGEEPPGDDDDHGGDDDDEHGDDEDDVEEEEDDDDEDDDESGDDESGDDDSDDDD